ncbi:hypothetical protein BSKO_00982 [Bryopsis sp. KO-2023]|nr:hypothetical protein BSKO_00982 [Bryopsis sp. KO-2023]
MVRPVDIPIVGELLALDRNQFEGYWNLAFVAGQAFLLGRRGWISFKEEALSPVERFQLRSDSLVYACWWALFSLLAIALAFVPPDNWGEAVNMTGLLIAEFVAISTWRHYFESGDLVKRLVDETHARLRRLLIVGLGLTETELKRHLEVNEGEVVALIDKRLKEKPWHLWIAEERELLFFEISLTCANVIDDHLWEGALSGGCSAYFEEWRRNTFDCKLRVPQVIKDGFNDKSGTVDARKLCVAVILSTEDPDFRANRSQELIPGRQFVQTRTVRRKVISEGILRWPDCRDSWLGARINNIRADTDDLYLVRDPDEPERVHVKADANEPQRVGRLEKIPLSVLHTLREILSAGYIKISGETTKVDVEFKHGFMVFPKEQWNTLMRMRRRPFRFITAATWLAGNVAFKVEQKEEITRVSTPDSGILQGTLKLCVEMEEDREQEDWLETQTSENVWGDTTSIMEYKRPTPFERTLIVMIRGTWKLLAIGECIVMFPAKMKRIAARKKAEETAPILPLNMVRRSTFGHLVDCTAETRSENNGGVISDALKYWFTCVEED